MDKITRTGLPSVPTPSMMVGAPRTGMSRSGDKLFTYFAGPTGVPMMGSTLSGRSYPVDYVMDKLAGLIFATPAR